VIANNNRSSPLSHEWLQSLQTWSQNLLLDLPGELRSQIYKFALTFNEALSFQERPTHNQGKAYFGIRTSAGEKMHEFNQLKFVCRQLYSETACLDIVYNKVRFVSSLGSFEQCLQPQQPFSIFLRELSPSVARWPMHVILVLNPKNGEMAHFINAGYRLAWIAGFCRQHSRAKVVIRISSFTSRIHNDPVRKALYFLQSGVYLSLALRHLDLRYLLPDNMGRALERMQAKSLYK
jgi:hypothetical protein